MSRRIALVLATALLAAGCPRPGGFKPESPDPVVWVDSDKHDWGTVEPTAPVEHIFQVRNTGGADLKIDRVQTSCGCTAAVMDHQFLKPGEETRLKITFDPRGRHGTQTRTVWIHSNDPKTPQKQIVIQATITEAAPPVTGSAAAPGGFPQVTASEAPSSTTMPAAALSSTSAAPSSTTAAPAAAAPAASATPVAAPAPKPAPKPAPRKPAAPAKP